MVIKPSTQSETKPKYVNISEVILESDEYNVVFDYSSYNPKKHKINHVVVKGADYINLNKKRAKNKITSAEYIKEYRKVENIIKEDNRSIDDLDIKIIPTDPEDIDINIMDNDDDGNYSFEESEKMVKRGEYGYPLTFTKFSAENIIKEVNKLLKIDSN